MPSPLIETLGRATDDMLWRAGTFDALAGFDLARKNAARLRELADAIARQPLLYCQENEIPLTDCMWEDGGCGDCARCRDAGCGWCASCRLAALLTEGEPDGDK